jgi:hypothetical protein
MMVQFAGDDKFFIGSDYCFGGGDAGDFVEIGDAAKIRRDSRTVLVIPPRDCRTASFVIARGNTSYPGRGEKRRL